MERESGCECGEEKTETQKPIYMLVEVKKEVIETLEVKFPIYKREGHRYYGFIDEQNAICVLDIPGFVNISNSSSLDNSDKRVIADGENISEADFFDQYQRAINSLSIKPILNEK